ncbi:unnamed protein product [Clonostachys solani]|uniref:Uncharacterized protein n=1 Tax=Clonostachys solani TaxID=160281 RepID=A0A9P0EME2_9HYPO|nr:unnamed protein product [Clonostachys solani]
MPSPPPPLLDPIRDRSPRHALAHEVHRHPQRLGIPVPGLVVEEEHVLVRDARPALQRLHVPDLGPRVDLGAAVEGVEGAALPALDADGEVEQLEQVAGEGGRRGAGGDGEPGAVGCAEVREGVEDGGDVRVEGEGLAEAVGGGVLRVVVGGGGGLEGRGDVAVDPEGPQGVVEVEDDEFWEGEGRVAEGGGEGFEGCGEGGGGCAWCGGAGEAPGHREGGFGLFIGEMRCVRLCLVGVWWYNCDEVGDKRLAIGTWAGVLIGGRNLMNSGSFQLL